VGSTQQELHPLRKCLENSLNLALLAPEACRFYLPACLYATTYRYLRPVPDTLWFEDEFGDPLHNNPALRDDWGDFASLLRDRQKGCVAHLLAEVLKNTTDDPALMTTC
jgi:hypothetical protein